MARPAPGSLAARTDLRNRLGFFKKKHPNSSSSCSSSGPGEVTIEVEVAIEDTKSPPKASPLVDYDTGPSNSPSLTISPTSSPIPGLAGSSSSHSPQTNYSFNNSPGRSSDAHNTTLGTGSAHSPGSNTNPSKENVDEITAVEEEDEDASSSQQNGGSSSRLRDPGNLVTVATSSSSPTPATVVMRKRQQQSRSDVELESEGNITNDSSAASTVQVTDQQQQQLVGSGRLFQQHRSSKRINSCSSSNEVGRVLKVALDLHFGMNPRSSLTNRDSVHSPPNLDDYIRDVFNQLDYHHCGTISREDFETLCEVINISSSPPASYRNSGIEWLSSYRPRPNSPMSPLRIDRLAEVKYRNPEGTKKPKTDPPPNFLFTLGPRPFWELWPQKKRKKKRLSIDDFKKALLEQWAKCQGLPPNRVSTVLPVQLVDKDSIRVVQTEMINETDSHPAGPKKRSLKNKGGVGRETSQNGVTKRTNMSSFSSSSTSFPNAAVESRKKRLIRSVVKLTRRYHMLEKISRRLQRQLSEEEVRVVRGATPQKSVLAPCPIHRPADETDRGRNGRSAGNSNSKTTSVPQNGSCSVHCQGGRGGPARGVPSQPHVRLRPKGNASSNRHRTIASLEKQVAFQQEEISTLREVIEDMRSSLQLSDAQNLALQVLLKKMAKAEIQLPVVPADSFRNQMNENEKQLENLVKELKEMSQIR